MIYYIDIDETICNTPSSREYDKSIPIKKAIDKVNKIYDEGHTVIFWTARGTGSGIDWRDVTESQLKTWGVRYHELKLGKPIYDIFIDDKNMNSKTWLDDE